MTVPLLWGRPAPVLLPVPFRCSLARLLPLARPWPGKANRVATAGQPLGTAAIWPLGRCLGTRSVPVGGRSNPSMFTWPFVCLEAAWPSSCSTVKVCL